MNIFSKHSVTLVELLLAMALIGLLMIGVSSLDSYARFNLVTADRRAQAQNEASFVLGHMTKNLSQAIGSVSMPGVIYDNPNRRVKVRWDRNLNGQPDDDNAGDWIAYRYLPAQTRLVYHSTYNPSGWPAGGGEIISNKITAWSLGYAGENYIPVDIVACWDPDETSHSCGTQDNPEVSMSTRIKMPAVSTN